MLTTDGLISLLTLTAMEIVLGVDNIIFIAILVAKLPKAQQNRARTLGIGLALGTRLLLLLSISWVMGLTEPLFTVFSRAFSGRDVILLLGGMFLLGKATVEIHEKLESGPTGARDTTSSGGGKSSFASILIQIIILDIVFSLDSVITAVGMAQHVSIMVVAMIIAVLVMMLSARSIGDFVHRHPTIKILALSFLILIGAVLIGEGMGAHVNKGYVYFAMAFSLGVELLNMKVRHPKKPLELKEPTLPA